MLIPRFTIRWLLSLTAVCALLALVLSLAVSGRLIAMALILALGSGVLAILLHAAVFCLALGAAKIWRQSTANRATRSPFARHTLPPQLLRPDEPD